METAQPAGEEITTMNCQNHPEVPAVAFCRTCGKALCQACQHPVGGTVVCGDHAPATEVPPTPMPGPEGASPGLAFVLGLIPGVGAVYNAQYAKGLIHVIIFGLLISVVRGLEPLFGLLIAIWYMYMPFEAYHTARKRQFGQAVDEFSSILPLKAPRTGLPIGPVVLIGLGVLFLLNTLDILRFQHVIRYWPVVLIVLGVYMLYCRMTGGPTPELPREEAPNEQR
jgi:TM2 domain-containing membrane protein YozV